MSASRASQRLLVTGAASGIGAAVLAEARARGSSVVGIDGPTTGHSMSAGDDAVRRGPLEDEAWLDSVVSGADAVIHTHLDARPRATYEELAPTNLDVTEHVYRAATRAGASRLVLVSRARLAAPGAPYANEDSPLRPHNAFEQTLHDAELLLRGLANRPDGGPGVVVLRAAPVYGFPAPPPSSPWLVLPALFAPSFDLLPGLSGGPRCHWAHVQDVAGAALYLATLQDDPPKTVHVADDTPLSLGEFYNALIEAYGLPLGIKVPYPGEGLVARLRPLLEQPLVLAALERLLNRLWRAAHAGPDGAPPTYRPSLDEVAFYGLFEEAVFDNTRLKSAGYALRHPDVRKGVRDMVAEYQRSGALPRSRQGAARLVEAVRQGLGSHFSEGMAGTWSQPGGRDQHPIRFRITLTTPGVHLPLGDRVWNLDGRLDADGLASDAVIQGTLELAPRSKRRLIYEFGFHGDDGRSYRLQGVKTLRLRDPVRSLTEMEISLRDDRGDVVGTGIMTFDVKRDLVSFVRSFGVGRLAALAAER